MADIHRINAIISYTDGSSATYSSVDDSNNVLQLSSDNFSQTQAELFSWPDFRTFMESIGPIVLADPIDISHIADIVWSVGMMTEDGRQVIGGFEAKGGAGLTSNTTYDSEIFPSLLVAISNQSFDPLDLNPTAYFDASRANSYILVDGKVDQWTDLSGNGNHVTAITAAGRPSLTTLNGQNALLFDDAGPNALTRDDVWSDITAAPIEIFAVVKTNDLSAQQTAVAITDRFANNSYFALFINNARDLAFNTRLSFSDFALLEDVITTNTAIWSGRTASSSSRYVKYNQTESSENASDITPTSIDTLSIGSLRRLSLNNFNFSGVIAEVMVINRILTADERSDMERYLIEKWGIIT